MTYNTWLNNDEVIMSRPRGKDQGAYRHVGGKNKARILKEEMVKPTNPSGSSSDILTGSHNDMFHRLQRSPRTFPHLPDHTSTNSARRRATNLTKVPEDPSDAELCRAKRQF